MPRPRKRPAAERALVVAVKVLDARLRRCERELGLARRGIGFRTDVSGDRVEQDDPDLDTTPEETRGSAGRRGR